MDLGKLKIMSNMLSKPLNSAQRDLLKRYVDTAIEESGEFFEVLSVSRADIEDQGFVAGDLTDEQMTKFADKLHDEIINGSEYFEAINNVAHNSGLKKS
mgnify:CR=1 FL=1